MEALTTGEFAVGFVLLWFLLCLILLKVLDVQERIRKIEKLMGHEEL
jgi:hypothetical protein